MKYKIRVRGSSADGRIYYSEKEYSDSDIVWGGRFIPIKEVSEKRSHCIKTSRLNYFNFNKIE